MAKKRSKRRRKSGRSSLAPSQRPSAAPESTSLPSDAKPSRDSSTDTVAERDVEQDEVSETKPKAASASEDDSAKKPAEEPKAEPGDLKEQEPRSEPGEDGAADAEVGATPSEPVEAKSQGEPAADQDDRNSDSGEEAAQDDGLHDDFFREGEQVEKEHLAAHAQAAKASPKLEDTGQRRLVALRSTPEMQARQKRLRKVVGYVLAPAVFIALVAGFKAYSGKADAAAKSSSPVAKVTVQPPPTASAWPVETHSTAADEADAGALASDAEAVDGDMDAQSMAELDAPLEVGADAESTVETKDAGADPEEPVADDVDHRKKALAALNRGKWEEAERMAKAAVAKDSEDATLYLYQGTALQEMGRRDEAKAVFKRCIENAKRGPINECRMFAQ